MKNRLISLAKYVIAGAILAWLIYDAVHHKSFARLMSEPKRWNMLAAGLVACLVGLVVSIVRWHFLVRAVGIPIHLRDSFRLGFVGYLLNFVAPGSVGGDLFKAVFLAREQPGRRAEALSSVLVDRVIGLYALVLVASVSILCAGLLWSTTQNLHTISWTTVVLAIGGLLGGLLLWMPSQISGRVARFLSGLRRTGHIFRRLIDTARIYRRSPGVLFGALLLSVGVHSCFVLGVWLLALGLPGDVPTLGEHFVIVPLAMVAGALPITPNGLGTFEFSMDFLYERVGGSSVTAGQGTLVALVYRVVTILIASIGLVFYLGNRRQVSETLREAQDDDEALMHALPHDPEMA